MKLTFLRQRKYLFLLLAAFLPAFWVANAQNLSNHTLDLSDVGHGPAVGGTNFSIENVDNLSTQTSFLAEEIFIYPTPPSDGIEMSAQYSESADNFGSGGTNLSPKYAILSNPSNLNASYPSITDGKNRLIVRAPIKNADLFAFKVAGHIPGTTFTVKFKIQELSGAEKSKLDILVNGYVIWKEINAGATIEVTETISSSAATASSDIAFDFRRPDYNEGDACVYAISDIMVYEVVPEVYVTGETLGEDERMGTPEAMSVKVRPDVTGTIQWQICTDTTVVSPSWVDMPDFDDQTSIEVNPARVGKTFYRAMVGTEISNIHTVSRVILCAGSSINLFFEDFGMFTDIKDRAEDTNVNTGIYTYSPRCVQLNDSMYAVVATPRYCGCGTGSPSAPCSDACTTEFWYRDIADHTGAPAGSHGGMLMVNCGNPGEVIYEYTVTGICANTFLNFSAWFANACEGGGKLPIATQFRVLDASRNEILDARINVDNVSVNQEWVKGENSFYSGTNTELTVQIINNGIGGDGNDILIDDIAFTACSPMIDLNVTPESHVIICPDTAEVFCGGDLELVVDTLQIGNIFPTPYYLWLKSYDGITYEINADGSNSPKNRFTVPATEYHKVIIASSQANAEDYFNGTPATCSIAAETSVMTLICSSVEISHTRVCNTITLTADTEDSSVLWKKSTNNIDWENISETSLEVSVQIQEDTFFKAISTTGESNTELVSFMTVSLSANPLNIRIGQTSDLIAAVSPSLVGVDYEWYADGIKITTAGSPYDVSPESRTSYMAVYDQCESNSVSVDVAWPTAFNPYNNDGLNDHFAMGYTISVFNRYGTLVFQGANGWDGLQEGKTALPGVYYYVVILTNGKSKKGTIEIVKVN